MGYVMSATMTVTQTLTVDLFPTQGSSVTAAVSVFVCKIPQVTYLKIIPIRTTLYVVAQELSWFPLSISSSKPLELDEPTQSSAQSALSRGHCWFSRSEKVLSGEGPVR